MKPQPWPLGKPFPAVLTIEDVLSITRMGHARFFQLKRIGKLPEWVKELPTIGAPRYCGKTLAKWAAGEWATTHRVRSVA